MRMNFFFLIILIIIIGIGIIGINVWAEVPVVIKPDSESIIVPGGLDGSDIPNSAIINSGDNNLKTRSPIFERPTAPVKGITQRGLDLITDNYSSNFYVSNNSTLLSNVTNESGVILSAGDIGTSLIIDSSESMVNNDPKNFRKEGAKHIAAALKTLRQTNSIAVIDFDSSVTVPWSMQQIGSNLPAINTKIDSINSAGLTCIKGGYRTGYDQILSKIGDYGSKLAIFLTDGKETSCAKTWPSVETTSSAYKNIGCKVCAIGFGTAETSVLQGIEKNTEGRYYPVKSSADLVKAYAGCLELVGVYVNVPNIGTISPKTAQIIPNSPGNPQYTKADRDSGVKPIPQSTTNGNIPYYEGCDGDICNAIPGYTPDRWWIENPTSSTKSPTIIFVDPSPSMYLKVNSKSTYYNGRTSTITIYIEDNNGAKLTPIDFSGSTWTLPAGTVQTISPISKGDGTYQVSFTPNTLGLHQMMIKAKYNNKTLYKYLYFTVQVPYPAPTVSGITPSSSLNSGYVDVTISGTNFLPGAVIGLYNNVNPVIQATDVTVVSSTKITCKFPITDAIPGKYSIFLWNTDEQVEMKDNMFTITSNQPTISGSTPTWAVKINGARFTLTGTNFQTGCSLKLSNGAYTITGTGITTNGASATGLFNLVNAPVGEYSVTLRNPNGKSITKTSAVFIYYAPSGNGRYIFRPSSATWYIDKGGDRSTDTTGTWGISADKPVVGDFNNDGNMDRGVFRPSTATWYLDNNMDRSVDRSDKWGISTDKPVVGDFNNDGVTDRGVFRPSTSTWYLDYNMDRSVDRSDKWGISEDIPLIGDFNNDGVTDRGVFRPSSRMWYFDYSFDRTVDKSGAWGLSSDKPLIGDVDGNGLCDRGVFRPSTAMWYIDYNIDGTIDQQETWGSSQDIPGIF